MYDGAEQHRVKTEAAKRVADLDPRLNAVIARFVVEQNVQPGAFLFQSRSGRAMHLRTATARLKKRGIPGFHAFRRFRITWLRDLGTPEDILRYWVGHQGAGITDRYSKLAENVELRKKWALRAGLGFSLDHLGKPGDPRPHAAKVAKKPGTRKDPKAEIVVTRTLVRRGSPRSGETLVAESDRVAQEEPKLADATPVEPPADPKFVASDDDLDASFFEEPTPGPTQEELDAELARLEELRMILDGVN
jgi:hypothetical protein